MRREMMTSIRKAGLATLCATAMMMLFSAQAAADSPTRGFMEFKMGPYLPQVDNEFDANGPYQEFFGNSSMVYGEFELDYHLWQGIGKLSLGAHAGYGRVRGRLHLSGDEDAAIAAGEEVSERATFRIIPIRGSLIYRYDYSAHNHGIPLVPVVKAGLNYNFWRVAEPNGDTAEAEGRMASGGRAGWHVTAGLHLHLDFLDRRSAAAFDMSWGIRNSYLFGEYNWTRVNGFGSEGIDLSANHWSIGLAFEF